MAWKPDAWRVPPESLFDLSDRTAIVTGGASGLGRAIAIGLGAHGASVVVADVDVESAEEVAATIEARERAGEAVAVETDVTDADSLVALREATIDRFGSYDILCNLPGINIRKPVLELDESEWRDVIDLNLTGVFLSSKHLGGHLVEQGEGSVINMASIRGIDGGPDQAPYSASKGGVIQLTKVLAAEWAPDVRVNALAPGYMKTPLVRKAMQDEEWYERMREGHLLDRFGDPEEVVGAAVFLAAPASSFVTGATLSVDGGWTAQ